MREPADDGVAWDAFAATASTPLVRLDDPAGEHRTVWLEPLPGDFEAELIKSTEARQVRAGEVRGSGSVRHVEVFRMGGVGTSIFGRPRRLPGDRRATRLYTLNWEEPVTWQAAQRLRSAYKTGDKTEGRSIAEQIVDSFPSCPIPEIARLGRTLRTWKEAFLAYFDTGTTNGGTEAINGLIELHRRVARGLTNFENYRLRMLLIGGGLNL